MKIRFLRDYLQFKPGDVKVFDAATARRLIAINYATLVKTVDKPAKDKMVKTSKKRKSKKRKSANTSKPGREK